MMDKQIAELERNSARKAAGAWFDDAVRTYERGIQEINQYRAQFEKAYDDPTRFSTPSEVLSWTVNSVKNDIANIRLDMAVTHGARLAVAEYAFKEAQKVGGAAPADIYSLMALSADADGNVPKDKLVKISHDISESVKQSIALALVHK